MHMQSSAEFAAIASPAQRAYMVQTSLVFYLLHEGRLPGWETLDAAREFHHRFCAETFSEGRWTPPSLCGPNGHEVSRFVPQLNELRMAPQDLNVVAYSHELAHSINPQDQHGPAWAALHVELLESMLLQLALDDAPEVAGIGLAVVDLGPARMLSDGYKALGVLS